MSAPHAVRTTAPRVPARSWTTLAVLAAFYFSLSADISVLFLATGQIGADLAPTGAQSLLILHIGEFLGAATVITFGLLAARLGPRRLLVPAAAVYGAASLVAAFSPTAEALIGARAVLGLAGAAFTPAALSVLRVTFPDPRRFGTAFSVLMAAFVGGGAAGPVIGGVLLEYFWWGSVFLINVPIAAVAILVAHWTLPRDRGDPRTRVDLPSVALSVPMVLALVIGMQEIADTGPAPRPVLFAALGAALVTLFVRRQRRIEHPLLDLSLFATRAIRISLVVLAGALLWSAVATFLVVAHLQVSRGLSTLDAGLLLTAPALSGIAGTLLTPRLRRVAGTTGALAIALLASAVAAVAITVALPIAGTVVLIAALCLLPFVAAPVTTLASQLIVTGVAPERAGSATAAQDVVAGLATAAGLAVLGGGAYWLYRLRVLDTAPDSVAGADVAAAAANPAVGAAVTDRLTGTTATDLEGVVADALTEATQGVHLLGALISLVLAAVVLTLLRGADDGGPRA